MICHALFYLAIAVWVIWAIFITRHINYWFTRKYVHLLEWGVQQDPQFKGFHRNDFQNWNRRDMILGGIFLLPIRFVFFFGVLISAVAYVKIMMRLHGVKDLESQTEAFQKATKPIYRKMARTCLFFLGFHHVESIIKPLKRTYTGLKAVKGQKPVVIISNHVSVADAFYLSSRAEDVAYVAKSGVANIPIAGFWVRYMQCVFVDRQNNEARKDTLGELQARVEKIEAGLPLGPLMIFPEGAVSNGRTLIQFKKGAFSLNRPLKVIGMKYSGSFSASFNMINMLDSLIGLMVQPVNRLTVIEVEDLVAPKEGLTCHEFAAEVKSLMCEEFGFETSENSLAECIACHKKYGRFGDKDFS